MTKENWEKLFEFHDDYWELAPYEEDQTEIIQKLVETRINPKVFDINMRYLYVVDDLNDRYRMQDSISYSVSEFVDDNYKEDFSPWFLAGYPDVAHWFYTFIRRGYESIYSDLTVSSEIKEVIKTYQKALSPEISGYIRFGLSEMLKLVDYYISNVVSFLEVAFDDSQTVTKEEKKDILATKIVESDYSVISQQLGIIQEELTNRYSERIKSIEVLFIASGIIYASDQIFKDRSISTTQIITIAKKSFQSLQQRIEGEGIVEFLIEYIALLLNVESPEIPTDFFRNQCKERKKTIIDSFKDRERGTTINEWKDTIWYFMKSYELKKLRKKIGILEHSFLFGYK